MNQWSILVALAGITVSLFGIVAALLLQSFLHPFVLFHLIPGAICLLITLPLWLKSRFTEKRTDFSRRKSVLLKDGLPGMLGVLCLLVAANVMVARYDLRFDTSSEKVYSLSSELKKLLSRLEGKLSLSIVKMPGKIELNKEFQFLELMKEAAGGNFNYRFLDPISESQTLTKLGLKAGDLVNIRYQSDAERSANINTLSESALFNEIRKLVYPEARTLFVVQGHGEPGIESKSAEGLLQLTSLLRNRGIEVKPLTLAHMERIPEEASAVLVTGTAKAMLSSEQQLLETYRNEGGRLLIALDPLAHDSYVEIVEKAGISVHRGVLLDSANGTIGSSEVGWHVVGRPGASHPALQGFTADDGVAMIFSMALELGKEKGKDKKLTPLLISSDSAWAESDVAALLSDEPTASFDVNSDKKGPLALALALEADKSGKGRLVVTGDADWFLNGNMNTYHNEAFAIRLFDWLSTKEQYVPVPVRSMRASAAPIGRDLYTIILVLSFLVPECLVLLGMTVWWRRRLYTGCVA